MSGREAAAALLEQRGSRSDPARTRVADPAATASPSHELTVSVIVPIHTGGAVFANCLQSLRAANPAPLEIIVVVDGGNDAAAQIAHQAGVSVTRTPTQSGPAVARNLGARAARGDILFFVDGDVTIPPTAVGDVAEFFRSHLEHSALIGSYDDSPSAQDFFSQYKNLFQHYVHQCSADEGYTFWGACGAVRREAFFEVGGFDERYRHPSIEDIELGYRLKGAGHRIRVCKCLQVKHHKRWGPGRLLWSDFFRRALPWTRLILHTGRLENDLNIDRISRLKVFLSYGLLGALGLSGWWSGGLVLAGILVATLLALDVRLLRFFWKKRGLRFAITAIPWLWLYYGYCGLAFGTGLGFHLLGPVPRTRTHSAAPPYCAGQPNDSSITFEPNPDRLNTSPVQA
jgi:glycosyltransferase involved in cell wall biosynthesis